MTFLFICMSEIDLLVNYPKPKRNVEARAAKKTAMMKAIARKFDVEYFDGTRDTGYGGYTYNPRFWQPVIPTFQKHYGLTKNSTILDVGCGKGFMLHDFRELIPGITVAGIDVSPYAIAHAMEDIKPFVSVANAKQLPYADKSFDLVISVNTIHNLPVDECLMAIKEIMRVSKKYAFITNDAYRTIEEKERMDMWNLTALTYMSVSEWETFFDEAGYRGDYYWFIP